MVGLWLFVVVGLVVHAPEKIESASPEAAAQQERRFRNFKSAQNVARQMTVSERRALLMELGYSEAEASPGAERDDLSGVKATGAKRDRVINAFRFYPKRPRQRAKFAAEIAAHPRPRDIRVRAHEKRLREKGLRRPPKRASQTARERGIVASSS